MFVSDVPFQPGEMLVGTGAISDFTGMSPAQILYAARAGLLPHAKIGKKIYCRRSELVKWITEATARTAVEVAAARAAKQSPEASA